MRFKIKSEKVSDTVENVSLLIFGVSAFMIFIGVSLGSFVPGIPVLIGILGSVLILAGVVVLIVSEFMRIFGK